MKKVMMIMISVMLLISCDKPKPTAPKADQVQQAQTERAMEEAVRQVGMPAIVNFQEKKLVKQIYELRDREDLICYAYIIDMHGTLHFIGKCIGYGLPYSTQFSNPEQFHTVDGGEYGAKNPYTMPQPEPNGLFMPEGLSATWLLMIDPETNEPRPVYIEPEIVVSPFKLK